MARVRVALCLYGVFLLYLFTADLSRDQGTDALSTLVPAWSLASTGSVYSDQYGGFTAWFVEVKGHVVSNRLPGAILWASPFYWLLGRGGAYAPIYPAAVAAAAATSLAVLFLYLAVRRITRPDVALMAALVVGLATPMWAVSSDQLWTHGPAQLFLALGLLAYARDRPGLGGLAQAGAILTRPHLAVVAAVTGIGHGIARRSLRPVLLAGLTSSLGVAALLVYYRLVYGAWTLSGGYGELGGYGTSPGLASVEERLNGSTPFLRNVAESLVSPGRGLFVYSPFLALLLLGLLPAWRHAPGWVRSAAIAAPAYAAVQFWNNGYSGEDFFAYRYLLEPLLLATPLLTLCYTEWLGRTRLPRAVFWVLVCLALGFQAGAAVTDMNYPGTLDVWHATLYDDVFTARWPVIGAATITSLAVVAVIQRRSTQRRRGEPASGATPPAMTTAART